MRAEKYLCHCRGYIFWNWLGSISNSKWNYLRIRVLLQVRIPPPRNLKTHKNTKNLISKTQSQTALQHTRNTCKLNPILFTTVNKKKVMLAETNYRPLEKDNRLEAWPCWHCDSPESCTLSHYNTYTIRDFISLKKITIRRSTDLSSPERRRICRRRRFGREPRRSAPCETVTYV